MKPSYLPSLENVALCEWALIVVTFVVNCFNASMFLSMLFQSSLLWCSARFFFRRLLFVVPPGVSMCLYSLFREANDWQYFWFSASNIAVKQTKSGFSFENRLQINIWTMDIYYNICDYYPSSAYISVSALIVFCLVQLKASFCNSHKISWKLLGYLLLGDRREWEKVREMR